MSVMEHFIKIFGNGITEEIEFAFSLVENEHQQLQPIIQTKFTSIIFCTDNHYQTKCHLIYK